MHSQRAPTAGRDGAVAGGAAPRRGAPGRGDAGPGPRRGGGWAGRRQAGSTPGVHARAGRRRPWGEEGRGASREEEKIGGSRRSPLQEKKKVAHR